MPTITIYTRDYCPYCVKAKSLLKQKGVSDFNEINIGSDQKIALEMVEKSGGRRTVPQIFIGDSHVGGFDDLAALDKEGKLDGLLG